ncbi:MAG: hypothetical protein K1V69_00985 [Alistipes sp.]
MYRYRSYIWLFLIALSAQLFILNNLSLSIWLRPMIFSAAVLLLPVEWRTVWVLAAAAAAGWTLDMATGCQGLYTASLLPLAMMRGAIVRLTANRSVEPSDQTDVLVSLSRKQLFIYLAAGIVLHHAMFFFLETMSLTFFWQTAGRIFASSALALALVWPGAAWFMSNESSGQ